MNAWNRFNSTPQKSTVSLPPLRSMELLKSMDFSGLLDKIFCSVWMLLFCKLTIGAVSAYDIHMTIKYVDSLPTMELNPVGRWLMSLDDGPVCEFKQISCFITAKFAGNFIALAVIELLSSWKRYIASSVAFAVAACQILLLYLLVFFD